MFLEKCLDKLKEFDVILPDYEGDTEEDFSFVFHISKEATEKIKAAQKDIESELNCVIAFSDFRGMNVVIFEKDEDNSDE